MPEGDTIFRAARRLDRALAGQPVTGFHTVVAALSSTPVPGPVAGRIVEGVEARGKHLLMSLSGDLVLHSHLRMHGDWHLYRPAERWRTRRADVRIVIETPTWHAIGVRVPVAEWLTGGAVARHPVLAALGPDLLADDFDEADALGRLRARAGMSVADALLDQRAVAGIGNVFKSEVLFVERVPPFSRVESLSDETLARLVRTARRLLRLNVIESPWATGVRRTTGALEPGQALLVYGRAGAPCRRCGAEIAMRREGADGRSTYWCPGCQVRLKPDPPDVGVRSG